MTPSRPLNHHLQRQLLRFMRVLEALPPGASLRVFREERGLRWQPLEKPPAPTLKQSIIDTTSKMP